MADKIKPLKIENTALGGSQDNPFPTEADPAQDYITGKGFAFENNDNRLIDLNGSGQIQFKDAVDTSYITVRQLRTAVNNLFDNTSNGFIATNVQAAIEEARTNSIDRFVILASYGGNANAGRFMEFFPGIDSDLAPLSLNVAQKCLMIDAHATATGTAELGFYDGTTLLYTATFTAATEVSVSGTQASPLFTLTNTANFKIKVISGSLNKPYITLLFSSSF